MSPLSAGPMERLLAKEGYVVQSCATAEEGLELVQERVPDLLMLDVRLPKRDGLSTLPDFRKICGELPIIVMTAFGDLETAVSAVKNGASDYITKPFDLEAVRDCCLANLRRNCLFGESPDIAAREKLGGRSSTAQEAPRIIGASSVMQNVFRQIALVADSDLPVLITGETGTGKELVAKAIHWHSSRNSAPYFPVAPVAFQHELLESELFGHVRGAFTGAEQDRPGVFELAKGGTILLDEIGDLPPAAQVKLLRVLDQKEYCRVGDVRPRPCDVRILAATNHNLHEAVANGNFREDLYYRLHGLHMQLPPLRERTGDIRLLCQYFLRALGHASQAIDEAAMEHLEERPWYGNVRELRNTLHQATVLARGRAISIPDLPSPQPRRLQSGTPESPASLLHALEQWFASQIDARQSPDAGEILTGLHETLMSIVEPMLIQLALQHTGENRTQAAQLLGLHRSTLREKLKTKPNSEPR